MQRYSKQVFFIFALAVLFGLFFAGQTHAKEMYVCQNPTANESNIGFFNQATCEENCSVSSCLSHTVSENATSAWICFEDKTVIGEDQDVCNFLCKNRTGKEFGCLESAISTALPSPSTKEVYICQSLTSGEQNIAYTNPQTCDANCSTSSCISHTVSNDATSVFVCTENRTIIAEDSGVCSLLCSGSISGQSSCAQASISVAPPPPGQPPGGNQPPSGNPPGSQPPSSVTPLPNQGIFEPLVTCGKDGPDDCTLCEAFRMVHRIIQFLFYAIMLPLVTIAFIIGGIILLTAAGNEQQINRGKSIVWNTFLGFLVAFAAWIIISTIIVNISPGIEGIKFPENPNVKWYQFPDCTQGTKPPLDFSPDSGGGTQPPGDEGDDDTTPPPPPGSTCSPVSSGPCAVSNLQNTCFGNNAENASIICRAESGGVSTKPSGGDKCTGDGKVVSWGLFQINISANKIGGLDCPAAFDHPYSGSNKDCRVVDQGLYLNCVRAAQNATNNIQTACVISRNGTSFNRSDAWQNTATACNIP